MARLLTVVATICFVLVAADAPAAPVAPPPREAAYYFPTTVGAKRVYTMKSPGKADVEHVEVVSAVERGAAGALFVRIESVRGLGRTSVAGAFEVSDRGVSWHWDSGGGQPPLQMVWLKLPHRQGQTWLRDEVAGVGTTMTATGPERVEVPAGVFDCIRVDSLDRQQPDDKHVRWFAHGVGEVKVVRGEAYRLLKSFTPGKD